MLSAAAFRNDAQGYLGHLSDFFIQRHIADQFVNLFAKVLRLCMQVSM